MEINETQPTSQATEATEPRLLVEPTAPYIDVYAAYAASCLSEVHPDYHVLIGLVIQAALMASKIRTVTNLHPNLAGLIVTVTGVGKSASTQIGIDLFNELVETKVLEDTPVIATHATVEGLLEALQDKPTGLIDLDEFGAFLKECQRDHMASARENFCRALDGRQIRYMRARNKNVIVDKPCPSVLGTVNMEPLRKVASIEDLIGGMFSRFLVVAPDFDFLLPQPKAGDAGLRERLKEIMTQWIQMPEQTVTVPESLATKIRNYAYSVCPYEMGERVDLMEVAEDTKAAFIRYGTHVLKVAILLAAGRSPSGPIEIREEDVDRAISIVERFRGYAERVFDRLQDADDTRLIKRVKTIMEGAKRMTFSDLHQRIGGRTKSVELRDAVDHLTRLGFIRETGKSGELLWGPRN